MLPGTQLKCKTREKQTNKTTGDIFLSCYFLSVDFMHFKIRKKIPVSSSKIECNLAH